ncbi:MAG: hypothetical protein HYY17_11105 [Planctomycetes bacterium]|nr:hypothetical protein [Planctomycetota bacterium]
MTRGKIAGLAAGLAAFSALLLLDTPLHHVPRFDACPAYAIVFGSGYVSIPRMMRVGAALDLAAAALAAAWACFGVRWLLC